MQEIIDFLENSKVQYLATIGIDGKPKIRPFQFMFEEEGKLWFCTSNQKEVHKELEKQPYVELCAAGKGLSWLRMQGKVVFSNSQKAKERILKISKLVKSIYKTPDNPAFAVFYLDETTVTISEIGKSPKTVTLQAK